MCKPILLFSLAQAEQKTERDMCKTGQKVCCGSVTGGGVVGLWVVGGWLVKWVVGVYTNFSIQHSSS